MQRAYSTFLRVFEWALYVFFAVLVFIVFSNVFSRFILNNSLPWAEELSRFLLVWVTFIGSVLVNENFGHMRLDLLSKTLHGKAVTIVELIVSIISLLVLFVLLRGGFTMMLENLDFRSPALSIPYGIINGIVPICSTIMFIQTAFRVFSLLKKLFYTKLQAEE